MFAEQDDLGNATATTYSVPVAGIIENYIGDYAFMTPETYERTFGEEADNLTVYARATTDEGERQALSEALRATGAVDTVAFNDEVIDSYKQMLRSVNMVVVVLVVAAAALAFIVLYNLTNINITERAREIATLKVLGFTPREVNAYIFREIVLLAMLGSARGPGPRHRARGLRRGDGRGGPGHVRPHHPLATASSSRLCSPWCSPSSSCSSCAPNSPTSTWWRA